MKSCLIDFEQDFLYTMVNTVINIKKLPSKG